VVLGFELQDCIVRKIHLYVMINADENQVPLGIYEGAMGRWRRVVHKSRPAGEEIVEEASAEHVEAASYLVNPRRWLFWFDKAAAAQVDQDVSS
jgi:hypothetical protein